MQFVTDLADQAVVLPALALAVAALFGIGWRRGGLALAGSALAVGLIVAIGKMTLIACPTLASNAWGLRSPSGHTAMAAALYGGLVALMTTSRRPVWNAIACAAVVAGLIGASRLSLGVHSAADVVVGTCIGVAGACMMAFAAGPRPTWAPRRTVIIPIALSVALLFHGQHLPAEAALSAYAHRITPPAVCTVGGDVATRETVRVVAAR